MSTTVKPDGVVSFKPHEKAPSFVKGTMVFNVSKFFQFCKDNPQYLTEYKGDKQLRCQILEGDYGLYLAVDTYKKEETPNHFPDKNKKDERDPW